MSIRAILFDFDGTLADSFDAITASVNHVRALHRLPLLSMTQVKPYVGFGLPHLLEQLIPGGNVVDCVAAYRQHHRTVFLEMTRLYSDVQATLVRLHQSGYKMAVCSNKLATFTRPLLQALGVGECFPVVLGPDDVPQPKPAPDMLIAALRAIGASSNEAVYVGDMSVPVGTIHAAGMPAWIVPTGTQSQEVLKSHRPDRLLESFGQLPDLLANAANS